MIAAAAAVVVVGAGRAGVVVFVVVAVVVELVVEVLVVVGIQCITDQLTFFFILMTLHDAIFTTEEYIPIVVQAFEDAFEQNDYPMSWKVSD